MWWKVAGIAGALGVLLGAFGAHGLESVQPDLHLREVWDTGAHYHLLHALALCAVAAHPRRPAAAGGLFVLGMVLFSGSLYTMALTDLRWLGAVTPLGGLAFVAGWVVLAAQAPRD
jgi:uncharacterized membrane protein YgdD (TMEM256/DUF423 family)